MRSMATSKKPAQTSNDAPKAPREKRPPRQFYVLFDPSTGAVNGTFRTKGAATNVRATHEELKDLKIAGPYVLAERVDQR